MVERQKIIRISVGLKDPKGLLLPRGAKGQMTAEIADEVATFWFKNSRHTKRFANVVTRLEKEANKNDTVFLDRVNKIVTKYPGMKKEDIRDKILKQLKEMGINVKKKQENE